MSNEYISIINAAIHSYLHDDTAKEMEVKDWFTERVEKAEKYDDIKFIDINMTKKLIPKQALVNAMHTLPPKEVQEAAEIDYIKYVKENMARDIGIAALEEDKIEFETIDYHSLGETLRGSVAILSLKELKEIYRYMERLELKLRLEESR